MNDKSHQSFPLSTVFLAVGLSAVLAAMCTRGIAGDPDSAGEAMLAGGLCGSLLGFLVGMHARLRCRHAFRGAQFGGLLGFALAPLVLVRSSASADAIEGGHSFYLQSAAAIVILAVVIGSQMNGYLSNKDTSDTPIPFDEM